MIAYIKLASDDQAYWAAALLVDHGGEPIEFAYTEKVSLPWPTRILIRDGLPGYVLLRMLTPSLLGVLERQPDLICFDEEGALTREHEFVAPTAVLAPPETRVNRARWKMLPLDVEDDQERAWWTDRAAAEQVERFMSAPPWSRRLAVEPFARLQDALREMPANDAAGKTVP